MNLKGFLLLFVGFCFSITLFAQNYDSLLQEIRIQQDTNQVITLITLGKRLRRVDVDSSINTLDMAYRKATLIGYTKGQLDALMAKGITYGMNDQYPEATVVFNEIVHLGKMYGYPKTVANAYNSLGVVYKRIGDYPTSYQQYNEALKIYKQNNWVEGMASSYENLGVLHDLMGEEEQSYEFYKKTYDIYDSLENDKALKELMGNIAIYYYRKKQYSKAIEIIKGNLNYFEENNRNYSKINGINNISNFYIQLEKYDSAIYYATLGIEEANDPSLGQVVASLYYNRALSNLKKGNYTVALQDALENDKRVSSYGYANKLESKELLARIYSALKNHEKAANCYHQVVLYKDSLFEENKVKQFKAEQIKQQVFDKNKQIIEQQADIQSMGLKIEKDKELKIFLIVISFLLMATIVLVYQKYSFKNKMNQLLENKNKMISSQKDEIEVINKELENRMLRAQINPHFIFNALSSIQHLITSNDKKAALGYLTKFSALLRQILENSINVKVPIADELKFLKIYLDLESLRFDGNFNYKIVVDPALDVQDQEVPILLLQPFVENAILHGLLPKEGDRTLKVEVKDSGEFINYVIEDNGIGRKAAQELKNKKHNRPGRGLSVTAQRINLLTQGQQAGEVKFEDILNEDQSSGGTRVIIKVPKI